MIAGILNDIKIEPNQFNYLVDSWSQFLKVKENYEKWVRKKFSVISPQVKDSPTDAVKWLAFEPPKIEIKLTLDGVESPSDFDNDPSEW